MTTTTKYRDRVIALRDRARHAGTPAAEAETALEMARKLCVKHGIDVAILDAKPEGQRVRDIYTGGTFEKKYPCRFGCSPYTQHTIEELNACAEKARNSGFSYSQAKPKSDPFDDMFRDFFRNQGQSRSRSTSSDGREHKARANGTHAYCSHEATKSARAKCRRERGY
jgi:hypothetical protein